MAVAIHSPRCECDAGGMRGRKWGPLAPVAAVGIRANEAGESGAEVAALVEAVDGCDCGGPQRSVGGAVARLVVGAVL